MTVSNVVSFNQSRNQIIQESLGILGVYGVGRTISAEDMNTASTALNMMVKSYQADGLHLWAKEEGYLFPSDGTGTYTLSADSTSAFVATRASSVLTSSTNALTSGSSTITVPDTSKMAATNFIGIVQADTTTFWTTISSVSSATVVALTANTTAAVNAGSNVYVFPARINKPMRILGMRRVTQGTAAPASIPMMTLSHQEYFDLPNKLIQGLTTHYTYDPQLTTGNLYFWPAPNDPQMYFELTFERQLDDFTSQADTPDFPSEWLECLTWQLAVRLAPKFGKANLLQTIKPIADEFFNKVSSFDTEIASVSFMPGDR